MPSSFIPHFHFLAAEEKLKPSWCKAVVDYFYYNSNNINLLAGKKIQEIDQFASGDIDMTPYKRTFKSMRKKLDSASKNPDGTMSDWAKNINTIGVDFDTPLALIPIKLNSAVNNIMRAPIDAIIVAQDALAMKKRKEDIEFLKNKPKIEEDLQELADEMGIGQVDIGTTKHSTVKFSGAPMGMDLESPEHEDVFSKLFYSLRIETAFEKALKQMHNLKGSEQVQLMLVEDHLKYGVGVNRDYTSSITGLPDHDYIYPGDLSAPSSRLPDCSDHTHRIIDVSMTVYEMFNYFSNEICSEEDLEEIINGKGKGYCSCNKADGKSITQKNWGTAKISLKYIEVRSVDWVGIKRKERSKRGVQMFTMNEQECDSKIWGQNTYGFYWLMNTDYFFGIHRLPGTHRTKGKEVFQNFSTHIYRSQKKSAVELSIQENKKAIWAELKLQHAIIKSLPPGKYIDLRFLRAAMEGLKDEATKYTMDDLLSLVFEHNMMLGDTEEFDGKNDGQIKPFIDMPGGLKDEARGYLEIIMRASYNIASITGINEQLTGQNSEELVGLQQLRINSGLNAIDYCNRALRNQFEALNNNWVLLIQQAIEKGGKTRQAIIDMIGMEDTDLLDALNEAPLHTLTAKVEIGNRYLELQTYQNQLDFLKSKGVVTTVDEYLLNAIDNPKERFQKLYFIEERWKKEQEKIRTEQYANMQAIEQQRGQSALAVTQAEGQEKQKLEYTKGDVASKMMVLGNQLGISQQQMDGMIKRALQKERNDGQTQKQIRALQEKFSLENQKAFA